MSQLLKTELVGNEAIGFRHLVVLPSAVHQPTTGFAPPPAILSRAEIARRRQASETARVLQAAQPQRVRWDPVGAPVDWSEVKPMVEMHVADVTPLPKNKGGRPRKQR